MLKPQWIRTTGQLQEMLEQLAEVPAVFIDTEFMRERTLRPQLALVQVYDGAQGMWLVDPLACKELAPLGDWLKQTDEFKVLHSCSEDMEAFQVGTGAVPSPVFDTQIAAAFCGYDLQLGYQRLVANLTGVELAKEATRSDWLQRPLTDAQVKYAVQDVEFLPPLFDQLRVLLAEKGREDWFEEECQRLTRYQRQDPAPDQAWKEVKGAGRVTDTGRPFLKAMAQWRELLAQGSDIARSFIVPDKVLLQLADIPPDSLHDLRQAGMHGMAIKKYGQGLLDAVRLCDNEPVAPLPFEPLDGEQKQLVKHLRQQVNKVAGELGLVPELLARRRWLEQLVRSRGEQVPEVMQGWRREVITDRLLNDID